MSDRVIVLELESYAKYFSSDHPKSDLLLANKIANGVSYIKKLEREIASLRTDRDGCAKACEKLHKDLRGAKQYVASIKTDVLVTEEIKLLQSQLSEAKANLIDCEAYAKQDLQCKVDDLQSEIEELSGGWISVDDQLPETELIVLVAKEDESALMFRRYLCDDYWMWLEDSGSSDAGCEYFTHWMPIPSPPKQEVDND